MAESDHIAGGAIQRGRRARLGVLALALAIFAGACSDDEEATPTPTSTTDLDRSSTTTTTTSSTTTTAATSTTTTSTPPSSGQPAQDEVIARYIGFWDARLAANSGTPNPDDPALREYATGAQLDAVIAETRANLEQGLAFRRPESPAEIQRIDVIKIEGDHAVVQECVVTDGVIFRRDTGEVVDGEVYTQNVRGELQLVDGVWKVSSASLIQQWEGVAGCASAS